MVVRMDFRDSFAPDVPADQRRRLAAAERARDGVAYAVFAALVAVLFGVAGLAVLLSGAAPQGTSHALFDAVAGGGALLVAVAAGALAVRGGAHARTRRSGGDRYAGRHQLAALPPELGALVARAQRSADRIRGTAAFAGSALAGVIDAEALDRIEWSVVREALRRAETGATDPGDLTARVDRLEGLADTTARIDAALTASSRDVEPPDGLSDELDRAADVAADVERYLTEK